MIGHRRRIVILALLVAPPIAQAGEADKSQDKPKLVLFCSGGVGAEKRGKLDKQWMWNVPELFKERSEGLYNVETKILMGHEASHRAILQGLTWVRQRTGKQDVAIIWLTSHGGGGGKGRFSMITADKRLRADEILRGVQGIRGRAVLIISSCTSGGLLEDTRTRLPSNVLAICSCHPDEKSARFGPALLRGLRGDADANHDGIITLQEIEGYVMALHERGVMKSTPIVSKPPGYDDSIPILKP
jgi:hypothetical protein